MEKIVKYLARIIPPMFETETVKPFLVRKLKWGGGMAPVSPRSGYAPAFKEFC